MRGRLEPRKVGEGVLHGEQGAAELCAAAELYGEGFWWTIGDEKRPGRCARLKRC